MLLHYRNIKDLRICWFMRIMAIVYSCGFGELHDLSLLLAAISI